MTYCIVFIIISVFYGALEVGYLYCGHLSTTHLKICYLTFFVLKIVTEILVIVFIIYYSHQGKNLNEQDSIK